MITQMADRCYLEKCRDRLYPEFVLAGVAAALQNASAEQGALCLGRWTCCGRRPGSWTRPGSKRLDGDFNRAYRYLEILFDGRNPYMESIERNLSFLRAGAAQRELAHAASQLRRSVRGRSGYAHRCARPDARLLQASLVRD